MLESGSDAKKIRDIAKALKSEQKAHNQVIHEANLEIGKDNNKTQWVSEELNSNLGHLAGTSETKEKKTGCPNK